MKAHWIIKVVLFVTVSCGLVFLSNLAYSQEDDEPVQAKPAEFLDTSKPFESLPAKTLKVKTVQSAAIMPDSKYKQWEELMEQFADLSHDSAFNQELKHNSQTMEDLLNGVDGIFLKLKNSQSEVLSDPQMVRNLSAALNNYEQLINNYKKELESMGDISEEDSLKLQIAMERRSKMIQTLSNILKKISQTQDAIISNTK